jgi:hypothetical protein
MKKTKSGRQNTGKRKSKPYPKHGGTKHTKRQVVGSTQRSKLSGGKINALNTLNSGTGSGNSDRPILDSRNDPISRVDHGKTAKSHTPLQQAVENWKARITNKPWWWLSYAMGERFMGVTIVQGFNFADAVNRANQLRISVPGAEIYGEDLGDEWKPRNNELDRLLDRAESEAVFGSVKQVIEADLYRSEVEQVNLGGPKHG